MGEGSVRSTKEAKRGTEKDEGEDDKSGGRNNQDEVNLEEKSKVHGNKELC